MQNCYVGDIGDYVKFAILRALAPGRRPGVVWWLYPDKSHNNDGKHIAYLDDPACWRSFDPELFDALREIVSSDRRRVTALEAAGLLPGAVFFREEVQRGIERERWLGRAAQTTGDCDLLFLDPDNGLEPKNFASKAAKAGKSVSLAELRALSAPQRTLVVYHHQTRMAGGHHKELAHWGERLAAAGFGSVDALRAKPYSARAFFLLNASEEIRQRAERLADLWGERITWHPGLGGSDQLAPPPQT